MKRWIMVALGLATLAGLASTAGACGDKFLIVGRCVNYQRMLTTQRPGHVLILWSSNTKSAAAIRDVQLQEFLQEAGHRVNVMAESEAAGEAIRSGGYDVVLVDAADADRLRTDLEGTTTGVLPVMYQATSAEVDQVRRSYRCALNVRRAPVKRSQLLVAVDDAMRRK